MGLRLRLVSVVTGGSSSSAATYSSFSTATASLLSLLLILSVLLTGEVDGYSLAAAKDGSRVTTTTTAEPPILAEGQHSTYRGHLENGRGGHGIQHHGHGHVSEGQLPLKNHHHHHHEDVTRIPMPDFERQLAQLKEDPGSSVDPEKHYSRPVHDEEMPIAPQSRKDGLFTPGLGVEEVSFLGPIRKPGEGDDNKGKDDLSEARPLDVPLQPDLLESEADVLEELKKLSALHDGEGAPHQETPSRPPFKIEEPSGTGIGGATGDHFGKAGEEGDEDEEEDSDGEERGDEEGEEREDEEGEDESNDEDEEEEVEGRTTEDPGKDVASLEERLSASLRKLAERRNQAMYANNAEEKVTVSSPGGSPIHSAAGRTGMAYPPAGGTETAAGSGPGTAPETASGSAPRTAPSAASDASPGTYPGVPRTYPLGGDGDLTSSAPTPLPEVLPSYDANLEKEDDGTRAVMKKAHMARKLMDPEDPEKDEYLLELMLRIAENPDEWKRVHHLLRQLDDDLTTYEKTMHRVEALALEKSSERGGGKKGRKKKPGEEKEEESETEADERRQEMSKSGLPAGSHGENLSSTTQHPLQTTSVSTSAATHHGTHKDWPRFAYHRVTTAPHPYFLQQKEQGVPQGTHHRNAYIAVSVITPPKGRHGGISRPIPSPPPVYAVSPTPKSPYQRLLPVEGHLLLTTRSPQPRLKVDIGRTEISEETLAEPMEEEVVENVANAALRGRHHKPHADPIEEQLRTLAAVEEKLRHHLHEKERMRHILQEAGKGGNVDEHHMRKRSAERTTNIRQHRPNGLNLLKTS